MGVYNGLGFRVGVYSRPLEMDLSVFVDFDTHILACLWDCGCSSYLTCGFSWDTGRLYAVKDTGGEQQTGLL